MLCYGMGLTQHQRGSELLQQVCNLLFLRGNFGKPGAGIVPIRGHSNVQGDRTCGIDDQPSQALLDRLETVFGFSPPREHGHNTVKAVEAMTTNESFFFRDTKPFDQFKQICLPALLKARAAQKTIRIWSAACSSGQEAYSLAMILSEMGSQLAGWKIDIIGTDLSQEILTRAKDGMYSQFEVQRGLPITLLVKYFQQTGDRWKLSDTIRNKVQYREWNLLSDPAPLGKFDIVYCRNVLIYFDQPTKSKVLAGIAKQMPDDGYLFLGGAETVLGISDKFQLLPGQRGIYGLTGGIKAPTAFGAAPATPRA